MHVAITAYTGYASIDALGCSRYCEIKAVFQC